MVTNLQRSDQTSRPKLGNQSTLILSVALPRVVSNASKFLEILRAYEPTQIRSVLARIHLLLGAEGLATLSAMTLAQRQSILREYLPKTKYTSQQLGSMQKIAELLGDRHDPTSPAALFVRAFSNAAHLEAEIEATPERGTLLTPPSRPEPFDSFFHPSDHVVDVWGVSSGREHEMLSTMQKAVENHRKLVEDNPEASLPGLAARLNNQGWVYGKLGRYEEGLRIVAEAVEIFRKLTESSPGEFLPDLAGSLNNLGLTYSSLGRREEALSATEEAVKIYRELAKARPDAFLPALANSLNNLGNRYRELGRRDEALEAARESVRLFRSLAEQLPAAFLQPFFLSVNNLTNMLQEAKIPPERDPDLVPAFNLLRRLMPDAQNDVR